MMRNTYLAVLFVLLLALGYGLSEGFSDTELVAEQALSQVHQSVQDETISKTSLVDASTQSKELDQVNWEPDAETVNKQQSSIAPYRITPSQPEYGELMAMYRIAGGPFMREGTAYFYFANKEEPYFLASPPELNDLMSNDTDQFIELKVEAFNQSDEDYTDNWGGDFSDLEVNYHYCKETSCLVRASHVSVTYLRDYVAGYEQNHPELQVDSMTTAGGDLLLIYRRR